MISERLKHHHNKLLVCWQNSTPNLRLNLYRRVDIRNCHERHHYRSCRVKLQNSTPKIKSYFIVEADISSYGSCCGKFNTKSELNSWYSISDEHSADLL